MKELRRDSLHDVAAKSPPIGDRDLWPDSPRFDVRPFFLRARLHHGDQLLKRSQIRRVATTEEELLVDRGLIVDELEDSPLATLVDLLEEVAVNACRVLDGRRHDLVGGSGAVQPANNSGPIVRCRGKVEHQITDEWFDLDGSQPPPLKFFTHCEGFIGRREKVPDPI